MKDADALEDVATFAVSVYAVFVMTRAARAALPRLPSYARRDRIWTGSGYRVARRGDALRAVAAALELVSSVPVG